MYVLFVSMDAKMRSSILLHTPLKLGGDPINGLLQPTEDDFIPKIDEQTQPTLLTITHFVSKKMKQSLLLYIF